MPALRIRLPTILVVEDDALVRMAAVELVGDLGFALFEVASADAALAMLERHDEITIVFTDIHMAGTMDGLELAALTHQRWPAMGFIIVSGEHDMKATEMPEGARFFAKPYSYEMVQTALQRMSAEITAAAAA